MIDNMPQGYNIGWETTGNKCVTTGACPASRPFGGYYLRFETIIWNWDESSQEQDKRTNMRDMIIHRSEKEAKKVHGYIVNNLKKEDNQ
ncbi:MAG TPA: hypothetical protein VF199_12515 [Bacillales bacterium]